MDKEKSVKVFLFTCYLPASYEVIKNFIDANVELVGVLFSPISMQRISWKNRIRNIIHTGSLREPKSILRKNNIPYSFIDNHNSVESQLKLKTSGADILILYGTKIIRADVLAIPKIGCLNAHSSLLPKYRGGKSEFWMLYNDETQYAGVTIHWVNPGLDDGDIFLQTPIKVASDDTVESLRKKSVPLAGKLFVEAIKKIEQGNIIRIPQDELQATKFKWPTPEEVHNFKMKYAKKRS